ncbi:carbon storage regulator CsrA [Gimesia algae]|uniref:Translational regulator CsrA n=1 Tax=Gimesia algae TaxID=2527971 RepID=A0A517VET0_9PLAN|nr:carbon storage regulator CsrA [Gimesia algae]QDT91518.1 hypothetical protein Pan161_31770 [Gimesia algae]
MLILTRKTMQRIRIADDIEMVVLDIGGKKVRLGFNCPKEIPVHRSEIYDQIHRLQDETIQETLDSHNEPSVPKTVLEK